MDTTLTILIISSPLLFATLGALLTEYAGVLAVFMEGLINLSAFLFVAFTILTGIPLLGFLLSSITTMVFISLISIFTIKTKANPFLTGLSVNLFANGIILLLSSLFFTEQATIAFSDFELTNHLSNLHSIIPTILGVIISVLLYLFIKMSQPGMRLKYSGGADSTLFVRGANPDKYKALSWTGAGFFASIAGMLIAFNLGAYSPNISAGRGWTALAAVFLAYRHPLLCIPAVLIFATTEYYTNIFQAGNTVPASVILSLPYVVALIIFILTGMAKSFKFDRRKKHLKNY